MDTIDFLGRNELFKDLNHSELSLLATLTYKKTALKNMQVIGSGDTSNILYLIKSGSVKVAVTNTFDLEQKEIILSTLYAGDHFGELSLLDGEPRSANVVTLEKCEFIIIHQNDFYAFLKQHPDVAISVIKYLCKRVRLITNTAEDLALLDVYGRLIKLLNNLAETQENGTRVIATPLTHNDIALRVGASREMVSRILNDLEKGEYLSITHKKITINRKLPSAR